MFGVLLYMAKRTGPENYHNLYRGCYSTESASAAKNITRNILTT